MVWLDVYQRYCKFGTLQYCVVRPSTTLAAIVMQMMGVYHEGELDWSYGYMYIMFIINVSVAYAFVALISFYSELKSKLNPFSPVGKFLCIKFIIFFAFWQVLKVFIEPTAHEACNYYGNNRLA